ncbi:hypothetical protein Dd586_0999 [Dickeya parazeae Ech586]|uniref:Uncharacterized protein n=1 Tax=Dickeya zeae (strain Ech586) TaxID=590409 RepID=D2BU32_DICZ5|nr:hypothetical protein Dd586_0999 [Dickeya parazeae Ech586]
MPLHENAESRFRECLRRMNLPNLLIKRLCLVLVSFSDVPGWSHGEIKKPAARPLAGA